MRSLFTQLRQPRCPRCGEGKLYKDMLGIVDACSHCQLTLKHHDAADGPTFFALIIVGLLVILAAAFVENHYEPALWIHAALWIPFTFIASVVVLRLFKTGLITIEYRLALLKENTPHE
ncbi:MAG: DUF983 domain-containing protein [Pseudomonadota bacterium]